jgi:dihydrofolate reductase
VKTDAAEEIAKLRNGTGKDMVIWGSLSLAQSIMEKGLIDQYELIVCPLVLGKGRPLFGDDGNRQMKLLNSRSFERGSVLLTYTAKA